MPRRTLAEEIDRLRSELASGEPLSPADKALLARTLDDVTQLLDEEQDDPSFGEAIDEELRELSVRLEQARPSLSVVIGRIVDSLSQLGI